MTLRSNFQISMNSSPDITSRPQKHSPKYNHGLKPMSIKKNVTPQTLSRLKELRWRRFKHAKCNQHKPAELSHMEKIQWRNGSADIACVIVCDWLYAVYQPTWSLICNIHVKYELRLCSFYTAVHLHQLCNYVTEDVSALSYFLLPVLVNIGK